MISGLLRQVIVLESPAEARSASGAVSNAPWTGFATVRAQIDDLGGSERYTADEFIAQATHRITIRYLPGVTTKMRVNFNGAYYDILNINNIDQRNRELDLICKEGRSHGNV